MKRLKLYPFQYLMQHDHQHHAQTGAADPMGGILENPYVITMEALAGVTPYALKHVKDRILRKKITPKAWVQLGGISDKTEKIYFNIIPKLPLISKLLKNKHLLLPPRALGGMNRVYSKTPDVAASLLGKEKKFLEAYSQSIASGDLLSFHHVTTTTPEETDTIFRANTAALKSMRKGAQQLGLETHAYPEDYLTLLLNLKRIRQQS